MDRRRSRARAGSIQLAPPVDYLPVAQTDLLEQLPHAAGGNRDRKREFAPLVIDRLKPYLEGKKSPAVKYYNFSAWTGGGTAVIYPKDPRDIKEMVRVLRDEIMVGFPDTPVYVQRGSLLSVDGNNSREIRLHFQGPDLDALMKSARVAVDEIPKAIPGTFPQPVPSLELNQPEMQLQPDEWRIARSGLTRADVSAAVRAFTGGLWAGWYFDGNERLDIIVKASARHTPEELAELPLDAQLGVNRREFANIQQTVDPFS